MGSNTKSTILFFSLVDIENNWCKISKLKLCLNSTKGHCICLCNNHFLYTLLKEMFSSTSCSNLIGGLVALCSLTRYQGQATWSHACNDICSPPEEHLASQSVSHQAALPVQSSGNWLWFKDTDGSIISPLFVLLRLWVISECSNVLDNTMNDLYSLWSIISQ